MKERIINGAVLVGMSIAWFGAVALIASQP